MISLFCVYVCVEGGGSILPHSFAWLTSYQYCNVFLGLPSFCFPIFRTITLKLNSVNLELDLNFMALDVRAVYIHTLLSYTDVAF